MRKRSSVAFRIKLGDGRQIKDALRKARKLLVKLISQVKGPIGVKGAPQRLS